MPRYLLLFLAVASGPQWSWALGPSPTHSEFNHLTSLPLWGLILQGQWLGGHIDTPLSQRPYFFVDQSRNTNPLVSTELKTIYQVDAQSQFHFGIRVRNQSLTQENPQDIQEIELSRTTVTSLPAITLQYHTRSDFRIGRFLSAWIIDFPQQQLGLRHQQLLLALGGRLEWIWLPPHSPWQPSLSLLWRKNMIEPINENEEDPQLVESSFALGVVPTFSYQINAQWSIRVSTELFHYYQKPTEPWPYLLPDQQFICAGLDYSAPNSIWLYPHLRLSPFYPREHIILALDVALRLL